MPLEVKIPKEINEYREKILFGLSIRQLICVAIAALLCTVTYFVVRPFIGSDLAGYLVLVEAMPIMGVGFLRINGFSFEKYMMLVLRHTFGRQVRVYKTELSVDYFDYYSDFGLSLTASQELLLNVKKKRYSKVRGEAMEPRDAFASGSGQKAKLEAVRREIRKLKKTQLSKKRK